MGCRKLTYRGKAGRQVFRAFGQERALEEKAVFFRGVLEKKGHSDFFSLKAYTYGFNGKEKDTNLGGGTHYDYGFRIYNPRVARFLSVDPLTKSYPMLTPYQFASNTPIQAIDLDGLEAKVIIREIGKNGKPKVIKEYDLKYSTRKGNGVLGTGTLYMTRLQNRNLTRIRYENRANKGNSDEISSFTIKRQTAIIKELWDYDSPTPPRFTYESEVQAGWKTADKMKILGWGGDLSYGIAGSFFSSNINSDGASKEWFKEAKVAASYGAGPFGFGFSYNSEGVINIEDNLSIINIGFKGNGFTKTFESSTNVTLFELSEVKGIGASFSLKYNPTKELRELYNNNIFKSFVPQKKSSSEGNSSN